MIAGPLHARQRCAAPSNVSQTTLRPEQIQARAAVTPAARDIPTAPTSLIEPHSQPRKGNAVDKVETLPTPS